MGRSARNPDFYILKKGRNCALSHQGVWWLRITDFWGFAGTGAGPALLVLGKERSRKPRPEIRMCAKCRVWDIFFWVHAFHWSGKNQRAPRGGVVEDLYSWDLWRGQDGMDFSVSWGIGTEPQESARKSGSCTPGCPRGVGPPSPPFLGPHLLGS